MRCALSSRPISTIDPVQLNRIAFRSNPTRVGTHQAEGQQKESQIRGHISFLSVQVGIRYGEYIRALAGKEVKVG